MIFDFLKDNKQIFYALIYNLELLKFKILEIYTKIYLKTEII